MSTERTSDAVLLVNTSDGRYTRYFAELSKAMKMISSWAGTWSRGALDAPQHADYLRGLAACFTILESRYTFEIDDSLMIDLSDSGFPHSYMLARISADRADALSEHLQGGSLGANNLKTVFLDDLFASGTVNRALLNRIACARYAEVVAGMDGVFDPRFMCGAPQSDKGSPKRFRLQWSAFDSVVNTPVLCGMIVDYTGKDLTRSLIGLKHVLKYETRAGISIGALAHAIDSGVADIHPITMSRATLGPMYLPGLTDGTTTFSQPSMMQGGDIMIEITIDHTRAIGSKMPSPLAIGFGVSPQESQVYAIRTQDALCYERGADAVERIIILPHRILQGMPADLKKDERGEFTLIPYINDGELL